MAGKTTDPDKLRRLTEVFRRLGAVDPKSWARSELEEGIPQLAHFVFLRQAWAGIVDERDVSWIEESIEDGKDAPNTFWGRLGAALELMKERGVPAEAIVTVVQTMQYQLLGELCQLLDDGGSSSPINAGDDWPRVSWGLFQLDEEDKPLAAIGGLHEYADCDDPSGREHGFRG